MLTAVDRIVVVEDEEEDNTRLQGTLRNQDTQDQLRLASLGGSLEQHLLIRLLQIDDISKA